MTDILETVVAARKSAEAEHINADGSPRTEAQHAAILIAQVQVILAAQASEPASSPPPVAPPGPPPVLVEEVLTAADKKEPPADGPQPELPGEEKEPIA